MPPLPGGLPTLPGVRIDQAHTGPERGPPSLPSPTRNWQTGRSPFLPGVPALRSVARTSRREEEVLRQTTQIAAHLRSEREELERREKALHEQHALLDQEWRSARMWVHEFEEDMLKRQSDYKSRESDLNEKIGACEGLISDLEEQERVVLGLRDQIAVERANLRADVDRDLEVERLALRQTRQALEEERRALALRIRTPPTRTRRSVAVCARLEIERSTLRTQVEAAAAGRTGLIRARAGRLERPARAEEELLSNRRNIAESATQRAQDELQTLRRREFEELRREREGLESQLAAQREIIEQEHQKLEAERRRSVDELAALKKLQVDEIEGGSNRVREEIEGSRSAELEGARSQIEEDLKRRVEERETGLRDERQRLEDQHRDQLARLEQERNLLENRIRFQQDHLQKARQEVEAAQQELRRQHQLDRTDFEEREAGLRLRWEQLAKVRMVLEEREQSLAREHALIAERRRSLDAELAGRSEALEHERSTWQQEREAREEELARREEVLAADSERLESRRQRLDGLRIELEETHRNTLEMRMAIEEVWAQLSQQVGMDEAKRRLAETQRLLEGDWETTRATITEERRQLAEAQAAAQARRVELEREKLEARHAADELHSRFDRERKDLADEAAGLRAREDELARVRETWATEKLEVEQVIRGLLVQLGQQAEKKGE